MSAYTRVLCCRWNYHGDTLTLYSALRPPGCPHYLDIGSNQHVQVTSYQKGFSLLYSPQYPPVTAVYNCTAGRCSLYRAMVRGDPPTCSDSMHCWARPDVQYHCESIQLTISEVAPHLGASGRAISFYSMPFFSVDPSQVLLQGLQADVTSGLVLGLVLSLQLFAFRELDDLLLSAWLLA